MSDDCTAVDPAEARACIMYRGHPGPHCAGDGTRWRGPTRELLERRQAELKRLAFDIVSRPINEITESERRRLIVAEPPRWDPDSALAKYVGDVDVYDYPDVLDRIGAE